MLEKPLNRAERFCLRFGLKAPILLAPMAGACPPSLSIAVANTGGLGAGGVVMMPPAEILEWVRAVRAQTRGPFQLNNMGLFAPQFVERLKKQGIAWFATVTTVEEARQAEAAGADVIVAQGAEAGGHRGSFQSEGAEARLVGLFSLLPCVVDAVRVPVVATGGIADARGVAAALLLGASAVQIGTGFLRCPEARLHPAWAETLARTLPEQTVITRVFSGRAGRGLATAYVRAAMSPEAPAPAPYPVQRMLTARMRSAAQQEGDLQRMQAWAGQSASLARAMPAGELLEDIWATARQLLS